MGRPKKGTKENPVTLTDLKRASEKLLGEDEKRFVIKEATIKDDFCLYSYEITKGIGVGRVHKVNKAPGIIDDDMKRAFARFNVHLAALDDVFKHSGVEISDIDQFHGHELTGLYTVSGFKISGGEENETIIIIGNKYLSSAGGRMELDTPKIPLDNLSSYKWYNELKAVADDARHEVALYEEGKYTAVQEDDDDAEDEGANQMKIFDKAADGQEEGGETETELDEDFAEAAV